jgi:cadmium resistance protein CadD (predicted permease)
MDTLVSYLISFGLIAFGIWIVVVAQAASSMLLVWTIMGLMPIVVGLLSLFSEARSDKKEINTSF